MKRRRTELLFVFGVLILIQLTALRQYVDDRQYFDDLMNQIVSPSLPASNQVQKILGYLRDLPASENTSYFLLPIFSPLRPTARSIAEIGGDCSDRARLLINLLRQRGIKATKWVLYSKERLPVHAVVEVEVENGTIVVDGLFGLWFPRPSGGYYGINDLRENSKLLEERINFLRSTKVQPGAAKLEFYPLDRYVYENARTINWDKSLLTQQLYKLLRWGIGEKVDRIPRPEFVEVPALMVIYGIGVLQAFMILISIAMVLHRSRYFLKKEGSMA